MCYLSRKGGIPHLLFYLFFFKDYLLVFVQRVIALLSSSLSFFCQCNNDESVICHLADVNVMPKDFSEERDVD